MKVHLHSEQFDGWLHAECGAGDWEPPNIRCLDAEEFEKLPDEKRCKKCSAYWWLGGGPSKGQYLEV